MALRFLSFFIGKLRKPISCSLIWVVSKNTPVEHLGGYREQQEFKYEERTVNKAQEAGSRMRRYGASFRGIH